jgi:hypothetical protein
MRRPKLSIFRAVLLLAPLGLSLWWLWTRQERAVSPFDDALDRALAPVLQQREVQSKLGAATSTQARLLSRELAQRSVHYLAPRDLELWQATRLRVARASKASCAKLWQGGNEAFLGPRIAELGPEALEAYVEMLARGFALRLERKPAPESSPGALSVGFGAVAAQLSPNLRPNFEQDLERRDLDDARACQLFLTLAEGLTKLEPAQRADFLRALAKALTSP